MYTYTKQDSVRFYTIYQIRPLLDVCIFIFAEDGNSSTAKSNTYF